MTSSTSIGRGPAHGSNENHDGDPTHRTMGEGTSQEALPSGAELLEPAAPALPAGVPGGQPEPGIAQGQQSQPDGPNVENSPWEPEAARGHLPQRSK